MAGLLQDDALKRDDIRIERKVGARHQRGVQPGFDVGILGDVQVEVGQELVEPVGHHALEQRRLVRHQAIQRLGGNSGAAGHGFGAGRGIAIGGKFVPRGLVDDLTRLVVGAELRTPAVAALGEKILLSAMLLHDACHSIDSSDMGFILEIIKFPNSSRAENRHDPPFNRLPDRSAGAAAEAVEALLPAAAPRRPCSLQKSSICASCY